MNAPQPDQPDGALRLLLVEDNPGDALLLAETLELTATTPPRIVHVHHLQNALDCLAQECFDLLLLDLFLPDESGLQTLLRARQAAPAIPIVVLTSLNDEAVALESIRAGAQDFIVKGQIHGSGLLRTFFQAVERKRLEQERERLLKELQQALAQVKTLTGLLPICCRCKKIRDDDGYWLQLEAYLIAHSTARFTHGFCPSCAAKAIRSIDASN